MKVIKKFFQIIILILNALALIALLLAAFSDFISPFREIFFSYLGLFFPFIFLLNLALFFVWLITKQWKLAGLNFLVFLICIGSIHTYFPIHRKTKDIPSDCIKILTYNVMRFGQPNNQSKKESQNIVQYICDNDADIVCIQEYGVSKNNRKTLMEKDINSAFSTYPYHHIEKLKFPYPSEIFGVAIFSKFPILSVKKVPYASAYNGSVMYELNIKGKKVTLINNHLESNKLSQEERNNYYQMTQDIDSRSLENFTKMMSKRLTPAFRSRALQAQIISKLIKENKNPYIIVCGDFNDTPISYAHHKIKGDLCDAFVDSGCGLGITYNRYRFLFRIDYILHSSNIKSYNCSVGKLRTSDHFPVWCYLQLK
ncbi:MAG: endonuclease/exonuclease/phosphatase family protein [Candidatus Symbiothrix sp.]|jgi:endonuclease/exonuclease/phosphatase family metal-dependent hydrolase|nr:endonuclease/exonuclease/phosphatase family protein [Candidatus Symbiothrix sp.]